MVAELGNSRERRATIAVIPWISREEIVFYGYSKCSAETTEKCAAMNSIALVELFNLAPRVATIVARFKDMLGLGKI